MSSAIAGSAATIISTSPTIHIFGNSLSTNTPVNCSFASIHTPETIHRSHNMLHSTLDHHDQIEPLLLATKRQKVTINISGTLFETLESTLSKYPKTLLGCDQRREEYFNEEKKQYCFPRDGDAFNAILYYYQSGGKLIRPYDVSEETFINDLQFFGIDPWDVADLEYGCENFTKPRKPVSGFREIGDILEEDKGHEEKRSKCDTFLACPCIIFVIVYVLVTCMWSERIHHSVVPTIDNNQTTAYSTTNEDNPPVVFRLMCAVWFLLEFLIRFILSPSKRHYLCSFIGVVDSVCVFSTTTHVIFHYATICSLPSWLLNLLKCLSFAAILKLSRYSHGLRLFGQTLKDCSGQLILSLYCVGICLLFHATLMYYAEYPGNEGFNSIADAFWYVAVTLTTVGYGDVVPKTLLGKLVGACCSVIGVTIVMAWSATIFVSYFTEIYSIEVIRKKAKKSTWTRSLKKFKKSLVHFDKRGCGFKINHDNNNGY